MVCKGRAKERRTPVVMVFGKVERTREDDAKRGCGAWVAAAGREAEEGAKHDAAVRAVDTFRAEDLLLSGSVSREGRMS
jgi:hypothetical protein